MTNDIKERLISVSGPFQVMAEDAHDRIEELEAALQLWIDAVQVDAKMDGPVARVSHHRAQAAWKATAAIIRGEDNE